MCGLDHYMLLFGLRLHDGRLELIEMAMKPVFPPGFA
jgi:hypothetical protein